MAQIKAFRKSMVNRGVGVPVFLLVLGMALFAAVPSLAQSLDELESAFVREHLRLDQESQRYFKARERDQQALETLQRLGDRMDQALTDESVPTEELLSLDEELGAARETAMERLRTSARHRRNVIGHLDDLDQLGQRIERRQDQVPVELEQATAEMAELEGLSGVWEVEGSNAFDAAFGMMKLNVAGATVSGTYRMSTGTHGSLHGTIINQAVRMQRVDADYGSDLVLEGTIDRDNGVMNGTFQSKILGTGRPESGEWSARKLSPAEVQEVEFNR